ncbi:hypothetical protein RRG08_039475 [Elysia crispata]|uniref:Uncharacterized protein n=1 Tax=Elysia crispata TaxID=231223 RepID=A0AAE0YKL8_9GAST|nr:hypothetical protein RRG08_039475 [Elysia crispata]
MLSILELKITNIGDVREVSSSTITPLALRSLLLLLVELSSHLTNHAVRGEESSAVHKPQPGYCYNVRVCAQRPESGQPGVNHVCQRKPAMSFTSQSRRSKPPLEDKRAHLERRLGLACIVAHLGVCLSGPHSRLATISGALRRKAYYTLNKPHAAIRPLVQYSDNRFLNWVNLLSRAKVQTGRQSELVLVTGGDVALVASLVINGPVPFFTLSPTGKKIASKVKL